MTEAHLPDAASDKFDEQFAALIDQFHNACKVAGFDALLLIKTTDGTFSKKIGHKYDVACLAASYMRAEKRIFYAELNAD